MTHYTRVQVGFLICDPCVARPELLRDRFWSQAIPAQLPYTRAAETFKKEVKGYLLAVRNFDILTLITVVNT